MPINYIAQALSQGDAVTVARGLESVGRMGHDF